MILTFLLAFGIAFFGFLLFSLLNLLNLPVGDSQSNETRRFVISLIVKITWVCWVVLVFIFEDGNNILIPAIFTNGWVIIGGIFAGAIAYGWIEQDINSMRVKLNEDQSTLGNKKPPDPPD